MSIAVSNITKRFGHVVALDDVSLAIKDGELMALLGPSGSGKTTLLRILAGLDFPDSGTLAFDGADMAGVPAAKRGAGFVFQNYALFRHMTVFDNVAFGLRVKPRAQRPSRAQTAARVRELLARVELPDIERRYPSQLSGGQRQRVALARALAIDPRVLLLDEPFGALDAKVRKSLRRWLRQLHDDMHLTSVLVTHDQEEALELADRVAILNLGRIEQIGTPQEVYDEPATAFVHEFLGDSNRYDCQISDGHISIPELRLKLPNAKRLAAGRGVAFIRADEMSLQVDAPGPTVSAVIRHIQAAGPAVGLECEVEHSGAAILCSLDRKSAQIERLAVGHSLILRPSRIRTYSQAA
jgi:sulfate/thiosulfate transport system ATP-binding protein